MSEKPDTTLEEHLTWAMGRIKDLEDTVRELREWQQAHPPNTSGLSPLQIETRDHVLRAMLGLLPNAIRAAKRGKPALLRLIVRTLRLKF